MIDIDYLPPLNLGEITHNLSYFSVPTITGNTANGLVNWGDGVVAGWSTGLNHTYSSSTSHTVVISMKSIDGFSFSNLTGITAIDASEL